MISLAEVHPEQPSNVSFHSAQLLEPIACSIPRLKPTVVLDLDALAKGISEQLKSGRPTSQPPLHCVICRAPRLCFDVELNRPARGDGHTTRDLAKEVIQESLRFWELAIFRRRFGLAERLCADSDPRLSLPNTIGEKATPKDQKTTEWFRAQLGKDERALAQYLSWWNPTVDYQKRKRSTGTVFFDDVFFDVSAGSPLKSNPIPFYVSSRRRFKGSLRDFAGAISFDRVLDRPSSADNVLNGPRACPNRHGVTGWIRSTKAPNPNPHTRLRFVTQYGPVYRLRREPIGFQKGNADASFYSAIYVEKYEHVGTQVYSYQDVIKSQLHPSEVRELEKSRWLTVKGNTGGWRPLRAGDDFMQWRLDGRVMTEAPVGEPKLSEANTERQAEAFEIRAMQKESPDLFFDGEEWAFSDDDRVEYIACQIKKPGRGRHKTDDERIEEQSKKNQRWNRMQPIAQQIIASGACAPSGKTKTENIMEFNGIKIDTSSTTFKHIQYEFDVHTGNYDTKKKLGGKHYESFRKKELEEYIMKKEIPTTKFTNKQIKDIQANDGRVVYAHIILDRARWYKLDMVKHESYQAALHEVWLSSINEAFKKSGVRSRVSGTNEENPESDGTFKEVASRFERAFRQENIYVMDGRMPTTRAIAQIAWEEPNQS